MEALAIARGASKSQACKSAPELEEKLSSKWAKSVASSRHLLFDLQRHPFSMWPSYRHTW